MATKAVAAPSALELQQALQAEAQALGKNMDASILDIRQAAETFDPNTALQQVCFWYIFSIQFYFPSPLLRLLFVFKFNKRYIFTLILAAMQVQSGVENTVTNVTAPFDVFSGNWTLNLLLFGVAILLTYSIATGPKQ